ncbi:MAG: hypothetical protein ACPLSJ_03070 [Thermosulfidibacteraceae bacterium]
MLGKTRSSVKDAIMVKVTKSNGDYWVEGKCWKCGKVLKRYNHPVLTVNIKKVSCPSCKALNLIEAGDETEQNRS